MRSGVGDRHLDESERVLLGVRTQAPAAALPLLQVLVAQVVVGLLQLVRTLVAAAFDVTDVGHAHSVPLERATPATIQGPRRSRPREATCTSPHWARQFVRVAPVEAAH